jgi:hypothetical protein
MRTLEERSDYREWRATADGDGHYVCAILL